jgi:hypothetical protein
MGEAGRAFRRCRTARSRKGPRLEHDGADVRDLRELELPRVPAREMLDDNLMLNPRLRVVTLTRLGSSRKPTKSTPCSSRRREMSPGESTSARLRSVTANA